MIVNNGDLMNKIRKNPEFLALILLISVLLVVAISSNVSIVKAQTQDSVLVYDSCGGTISADGTNLTGGASYSYANGAAVTFTSIPATGFTFFAWEVATAAGPSVSTTNPLVYTISGSAAIQAMYTPISNATAPSTSILTGTTPFDILASIGGTTTPASGTYTNYNIGTILNIAANPGTGFKFLYWVVSTSTGFTTTNNPLEYNVSANSCGVQALFVPTSSTVALPTPAPTINEFSSTTTIITTLVMIMVAFGAYAFRRKAKR